MPQAISTRETRDFAREIKFLIDPDTAARVREWARARLSPDPYASGHAGDEYRTTSLYFDSSRLDVFHRQGSNGRSKYRIRRYGAADVAFLERKLRTAALLTKRRTVAAIDGLQQLERAQVDSLWPGAWFHRRVAARQLRVHAQVAYHRHARVGLATWGPMRLTLDDDIRAVPAAGLHFRPDAGVPVLPDHVVLELKYRVDLPAVFRNLVEAFSLQPQAISKYRLAVPALGLAAAADPALAAVTLAEPRHA